MQTRLIPWNDERVVPAPGGLRAIDSLWAKSDAGGCWHSLPAHLLDAAAVGELIWDDALVPATRRQLDRYCAGHGRDVLRLMCGWHDLGKATPAFQSQIPALVHHLARWGVSFPEGSRPGRTTAIQHGPSGSLIAQTAFGALDVVGAEWLLPVISGHHGSFLHWNRGRYRRSLWHRGPADSTPAWGTMQQELATAVYQALGVDVSGRHLDTPPLPLQLAFAGFVSMADWIASSTLFPGLADDPATIDIARSRARRAWQALGFAPTTMAATPMTSQRFRARFGRTARPLQDLVIRVCDELPEPGLVIVEAPMGEGKTEAAFAAIETLAARFGLDGFVFAMPTQGTTDAMYDRVVTWASAAAPAFPVSLLHGKAMVNERWRALLSGSAEGPAPDVEGVFDPVLDEGYGIEPPTGCRTGVPSEWLLGRHRGLLSPGVVGTVDQCLMAATHIKYVALRHAGLVGKVLVIDEVHSYDVYMSQYLHQLLRWCRDAGVPVVLMSATLPPEQRRELIDAYAGGLAGPAGLPGRSPDTATTAYPVVTTWTPSHGVRSAGCDQARADLAVQVEPLPVADVEDTSPIAEAAADLTASGGCALVVLNTVRRAQRTYQALKDASIPTMLLHGRLTTGERARRTAHVLSQLGVGGEQRPDRLVVVATQIAEQSFDVDADVLLTDICPTDLLLQRIGRLHRHSRDAATRGRLARPRVLLTGVRFRDDVRDGAPPEATAAFDYVYDRHALLRTAALTGPTGTTWAVPSQTPSLVARAYAPDVDWPPGWDTVADEARAAAEERRRSRSNAATLGLLEPAVGAGTLDRLHSGTGAAPDERHIAVRDGEPNVEVALVRRDSSGGYTTLDGSPLGTTGERCTDDTIALRVLRDTVRMYANEPVLRHVNPLPGWSDVPLLRSVKAVELDSHSRSQGPWGVVSYDHDTGLSIERSYHR